MSRLNPICVALDTPDLARAEALTADLRAQVGMIKLGMEFFYAHGPAGYERIAGLGIPVFLDLKLPLRSGFEVLEWLRTQSALARTTVVVLSSSAEARDVERAYQLGAQGYLVKYPEAPVLLGVVQQVHDLPASSPLNSLVLPGLVRS